MQLLVRQKEHQSLNFCFGLILRQHRLAISIINSNSQVNFKLLHFPCLLNEQLLNLPSSLIKSVWYMMILIFDQLCFCAFILTFFFYVWHEHLYKTSTVNITTGGKHTDTLNFLVPFRQTKEKMQLSPQRIATALTLDVLRDEYTWSKWHIVFKE